VDEIHFLIECPVYNSLREELFSFAKESSMHFNDLSNENK
jgi:hypothetical protein